VTSRRRPAISFAVLCLVCISVAGVYLLHAEGRAHSSVAAAGVLGATPVSVAAASSEAHVTFRNMREDDPTAGQVGLASLGAPDGPRAVTGLRCMRVYVAAGNGICLALDDNVFSPYRLAFFGPDFNVRREQPLGGVPSRARVSPDGRYGSSTVFVSGDSYASGSFSTRTRIWDMATGDEVAELEQFTVWRDGKEIQNPDFNFWGVTFAGQPGTFYATLGTGGHRYLVRGDLASKGVEVLRDGVECPSLSPDGTRLAFKQRVGSGPVPEWRPAVLDLATLQDHPLAETRSVDDQIEWLDDHTVLYAVDTGTGAPSIWSASADGRGQAQKFVTGADSPAVVRG
jgi:hypothetical protein